MLNLHAHPAMQPATALRQHDQRLLIMHNAGSATRLRQQAAPMSLQLKL